MRVENDSSQQGRIETACDGGKNFLRLLNASRRRRIFITKS